MYILSQSYLVDGFYLRGLHKLKSYVFVLLPEFLNIDDDDLTEMADDNEPGAEEAQYTDNSGWSSRTR